MGFLAHDCFVTVPSSAFLTLSLGKFTITFFFDPVGAGAATGVAAAAGGKGLTFLCGPPNTAFGGPPVLILWFRLLLGTNGGGNCPGIKAGAGNPF